MFYPATPLLYTLVEALRARRGACTASAAFGLAGTGCPVAS